MIPYYKIDVQVIKNQGSASQNAEQQSRKGMIFPPTIWQRYGGSRSPNNWPKTSLYMLE